MNRTLRRTFVKQEEFHSVVLLTVINTILPLLYLHNYSAARSKSEPETISNQLIFFLPYKISFDYTLLYPAIRVSFDLPRYVGNKNEDSTSRIDIH